MPVPKSYALKPGRIACCVPFCRRTARDDGAEGHEIICGKHWRLADKELTQRYKKLSRQVSRDMEKDPHKLSWSERERIVNDYKRCDMLWRNIKTQAIERAAGL